MNRHRGCFLLTGFLLLALATPLISEDQPAVFTRVAFWNFDRQYWEEYQKNFKQYDQPVFEKLLADGVITEWGSDAEGVHTAEGATHSTWFSEKSIASLERALEEVQNGMSKMSPEEREAIMRAYEEVTVDGSHRDDMSRILHYSSK